VPLPGAGLPLNAAPGPLPSQCALPAASPCRRGSRNQDTSWPRRVACPCPGWEQQRPGQRHWQYEGRGRRRRRGREGHWSGSVTSPGGNPSPAPAPAPGPCTYAIPWRLLWQLTGRPRSASFSAKRHTALGAAAVVAPPRTLVPVPPPKVPDSSRDSQMGLLL